MTTTELRLPLLQVAILAACRGGEVTCAGFAHEQGISARQANNHFRALERAGLIVHRKVRSRALYRHVYRAA